LQPPARVGMHSSVVHLSLSSHFFTVTTHPSLGLHTQELHSSVSVHLTGGFEHLQDTGSQISVVQLFLSSQSTSVLQSQSFCVVHSGLTFPSYLDLVLLCK